MRVARLTWISLITVLMITAGCSKQPAADLVLVNGRIYTVDQDLGSVEALAVLDGIVVAVGSSADSANWIGDDTEVIDLDGAFAIPGFNDAHVHVHNAAEQFLALALYGTGSRQELIDRVREQVAVSEPGQWVYGRGWDESLWPDARIPSRSDLDTVSTKHPIYLKRVDGHSAVVNSLALELAEFDCVTPPPEGGVIVCEQGEPTGWVKERASVYVNELIPPPSLEQRTLAYRQVIEDALRHGVTSLQDDSIRVPNGGWAAFEALQALSDEGLLDLRVTEWLNFEAPLEQLLGWRDTGGTTDPWLKTGLLKTNIDGSGGSLSAAMLEPYATARDNMGVLIIAAEELEEMVIERIAAGFQIGIHTIGDRATRVVLDAYQAAIDETSQHGGRLRVEHAQFIHDDDIERFAELEVIASMQPNHILSDMRWAPEILGPDREHHGYRWRSLLDSGAILAFGTDYPVEPIDPMRGLYAAVTREFEHGGPEGGWVPEEKLTIEEAIQAYTWGSAFAEFEDHRKGTLGPGKFADIVVLSNDLIEATPRQILETEVLMTMVGGRVVFRKE